MQRLNIDTSHSGVHFTARHMVVTKVRGVFHGWSGTIDYDPERIERSSVTVEIDAASIDTREPKRDGHLKSADFFDVENHPKLTFKSTKVERSGDGLKVTGDLTIRGVTKPVTLDVEEQGSAKDPWGNTRLLWAASAKINRKDWGLNWNQVLEAGGVLVSEKIDLEFEVQALPAG
jgi:polyisoprenoid-binding protein YceI